MQQKRKLQGPVRLVWLAHDEYALQHGAQTVGADRLPGGFRQSAPIRVGYGVTIRNLAAS